MDTALIGKPQFRWTALLLIALLVHFASHSSSPPVFAQTATLAGISGTATGATTATVTVTLNNPDSESVTVYFRYGTGGVFEDVVTLTTSSTQVQQNLTGLTQGTVYSIQVALTNEDPFVPGASGTVTTGTPSISTVADSEVDHDSAKITVTVAYPNSSTVNLRYKRTADPDPVDEDDPDPYTSVSAKTTTETDASQALVFSLSGLDSSTGYTVQASFQNDYSAGVVSDTFTTTAPPSTITSVADSEVDHDSAKITVTVSNPASGGTTVYLQHKKNSEPNWPAVGTATQLTATSASPSPSHTYSGLDSSTSYNVRASLNSDFSDSTGDTFTTTAPPPAISGISIPDANRTHNSAKIEVSVSNVASGGTTVYYQHKKNSDSWPTTTPPTLNATTSDTSPEATLSGLDANTQYNVRASLQSDMSSPQTQNFTTRQAPSVSGVSVGTITHGTARATVSLSNALNTTVYLRHKVSTAADSTYVNATSQTTSASSVEFSLSGLSPGVGYTVQSSLVSNHASGVQTATFTTPSIGSVTISGETHKGATATVTVANMTTATSDTTVHLRYQASDVTSWTPGGTMTATSSSSSPAFNLSALSPGKTYTVEAAFDSGFAIGKVSATFTTPGISSITASSITHNSATVSATVSNPNSTTVYLQYKQDNQSSWQTPSSASLTATDSDATVEFALSGLYRFTDFDVRVSFESAFPSGNFTEDEDKLFKTLSTIPNAPTGLTLTTTSRGAFTASWTAPADDGGNAIDGYRVQWKSGTEVYNTSDRQESSTTTSHTKSGLVKGAGYTVQVTAFNDNNSGATDGGNPSTSQDIILIDLPNAPASATVAKRDADDGGDSGKLVVSWSAPTTVNDLHPVHAYVVRWKCGSDDYTANTPHETANASTTDYTISGLTNGTSCTVKVNAKNYVNSTAKTLGEEGPDSSEPSETPGDEPSPARNLAITAHHDELVVNWDAPADLGGFPITGYTVKWTTGGTTQEASVAAGTTEYDITGLQSNTSYTVLVISTNAIGDDTDDLGTGETRAEQTITTRMAPVVSSVTVPEGGDDTALRTVATATVSLAHGDVRNANTIYFRYSVDSTPGGATATPGGWTSLTSQDLTVDSDLAADDTITFSLSSLTGNTHYVVQSSLDSTYTAAVTAQDRFRTASLPPGAPTGLELKSGEFEKLTLQWEAPDDGGTPITGYRVHWEHVESPGFINGSFVVTGDPVPLRHTFSTVGDMSVYDAWVFAINLHGDGPQSAVIRGQASQVPGEPDSVRVESQDKGILVDWGDAPGRGNEVTDYIIQWKLTTETLDDVKEALATKHANVIIFSYTITGLENGTEYDIRVLAANSNGRGLPSAWIQAIPVGPIGVPQNVTATAGNGTISVAWQPPPASAGDTPTGYTVEWKRSTDNDTQWQSAPGATSPHEISGLDNGTTYNVRVFAVVRLNDGEPSTPVNAIPNTIPDVPANIRVTPRNESLIVSWPAPFDGGSPITGYTVQWTESGGTFGTNEGTTTSRSFTITGLINGDEYDIRVVATNVNGSSEPSVVVRGTPDPTVTPPPPPTLQTPGAPTSVAVTAGNEELLVTWAAPTNTGGATITSYVVQWTESGGNFGANESATTDLQYTIVSLTNDTEYDVRVIAVNSEGRGTPSSAESATPTAEVVPTISAVTVPEDDLTESEAKVTVSIANTDGTSLDVYLRYRPTTPEGETEEEWSEALDESTTTESVEFTLSDLDANAEYEVQASLDSTFSDDATVSATFTTASTVPGAPQNVSVTEGRGELMVTWEAPDDDGGSPITGYAVQWKSGEEEFDSTREAQIDSDTLAYTITELSNEVEYTVQVLAINDNGQSEPSDTATGMPSETITGMIQLVTVESESASTAEVTVVVSGADEDHPVAVHMRHRVKPDSEDENGSSGVEANSEQIFSTLQETGEWSEVQSVETSDGIAEFTLTDLVADTEYEIQVSLDDTFAGDAPISSSVFTLATVPAAPTGVELIPGDGEITVKWVAPADDGGSAITGYIVRWQPAQAVSDPPKQSQVEADDLMYTIGGLENDTEYELHVVAVNVIGESDPSEVANATPTAAAVTTIGLVTIRDVSQTDATVEVALLNRDDSAATTVYLRYRSTTGQQAWSATGSADATTDTVEFALSGLSAGTGYEVQASLDNAFPADAIVSASFTTLAAPQPPRITSAGAFTVNEGEIRVATLTASDADTPASQLTWSILPASSDGSKFMLSTGGSLVFRSAKDYENPDDANGDGTYELTVQVSDGELTDSAEIRVTLRDVAEQVSPTPTPAPTQTPVPSPTPTPRPAITVNYQTASYSVGEGASVSISVRLSSSPTLPITVPIRVLAGGTAEQQDYTLTGLVGGSLQFAPGQVSKSFRLMSSNDSDTDDETVRLGFGQLPGGLSAGNNRTTTVTIRDDDVAADTGGRSSGSRVRNSPPRFTERHNAVRSVEENVLPGTEVGAPVAATDADRSDQSSLTYRLSGVDAADFSIIADTGQILTATELDFENRSSYRVVLIVTDRRGGGDLISVSISVTDVNEPPLVGGADSIEYPENSEVDVGIFVASDPEGDAVSSMSLSGEDASLFSVDASGTLTFKNIPDYEEPGDENSDNTYKVIVEASDGQVTGALAVSVRVTDGDDQGTVTFSREIAQAGIVFTATLSDQDSGLSDIAWMWERSPDGSDWTIIGEADSSTYTPVGEDTGAYLRATVTYSDIHGSDRSVRTVTSDRVRQGAQPTATPVPTSVPMVAPTATPTIAPTALPTPTPTPTAAPGIVRTPMPAVHPTATPSPQVAAPPTASPTVAPSATATPTLPVTRAAVSAVATHTATPMSELETAPAEEGGLRTGLIVTLILTGVAAILLSAFVIRRNRLMQ